MANRNFHNSNKKTKYGEHDVKFWIGTVAGYASQEKQLEGGYGWMYKVRIDGDHSNDKKKVKDEQLSYAYCILPTTAGSGAAYKLRSVRISQGDTVFGVRGGGVSAPAFIIGVFPRTRETVFATTTEIENGTKSGGLTGFYGSLTKNKTLDGEFNDQIGPKTPSTDAVGPKNYSKAEKREPSDKSKELGAIAGGDENLNVDKLTPKKMLLSLKDYAKNLFKGEDAVNSKENLDKIIDDVNKDKSRTNTEIEVVKKAIDTSVKQNLIEEEEAKNKKKELDKLEVVNVNDQGIILNSEAVRNGLLTYVDGNGKQFVKFTSPSGKVTFEPADEVKKSAAKTKAYNDRIKNEEINYEVSSTSTDSELTETFTISSSSDVTYDESTNTYIRSSETTVVSEVSGVVNYSEKPKTVTGIKIRLEQNIRAVEYMIGLYNSPQYTGDRKTKIAEANNQINQLKNFINTNPSGYDGSSLQTTLKSSYSGIYY